MNRFYELGYFGNIWVRQNSIDKAGGFYPGHKHHFDHVTLLVQGKILIEVDGYEPKEFVAPTFVVIKKDKQHKITALTDNVMYYCVFALRDDNGEVIDPIYADKHNPLSAKGLDSESHKPIDGKNYTWSKATKTWVSVPMPEDAGTGEPPKRYQWDEATVSWKEVETVE